MQAREGRLRADYRTDARSTVITAVDIYAVGCGGDLNSAGGRAPREARRQEP
jgi:hypothetical protein